MKERGGNTYQKIGHIPEINSTDNKNWPETYTEKKVFGWGGPKREKKRNKGPKQNCGAKRGKKLLDN